MNWIIAGCHCCDSVIFHVLGGEVSGGGKIADNDRFDESIGTWSSETDVPSPARIAATAFTVSKTAYLVTGQKALPSPYIADNDSYVLDTWTAKADCLAQTDYARSGVIDGLGYVVFTGGSNYEYDPTGDSWDTKTSRTSPATMQYPAAFSVDGGVYIASGLTSGNNKETVRYDSNTDSWTGKTDHLRAKQQGAGMAIGTKGYTFGGLSTEYEKLDEYDPTADTWTAKSSNIAGTANLTTVGFKKIGYATGGAISSGGLNFYDYNSTYTPATDTWGSSSPLITPKRRLAACTSL